jgi:hypothetical protein
LSSSALFSEAAVDSADASFGARAFSGFDSEDRDSCARDDRSRGRSSDRDLGSGAD